MSMGDVHAVLGFSLLHFRRSSKYCRERVPLFHSTEVLYRGWRWRLRLAVQNSQSKTAGNWKGESAMRISHDHIDLMFLSVLHNCLGFPTQSSYGNPLPGYIAIFLWMSASFAGEKEESLTNDVGTVI